MSSTESSRVKATSILSVPDTESVYLQCLQENLESPCCTTKGGRVHVQVSSVCVCVCLCVCVCVCGNSAACSPNVSLIVLGETSPVCVEPHLLLSPSSPPSPMAARSRERERARAREPEQPREQSWPPALNEETMATRLRVTAGDRNRHKHRNCPFCHWDRPAEAWESGGGTLSLSPSTLSLFLDMPKYDKKRDTLTDCTLWSHRERLQAPQSRRESCKDILGHNDGVFELMPWTSPLKLHFKTRQTPQVNQVKMLG